MRDIPGWEGLYAATSCGKIWSHKRKKFMAPCGYKGNYQQLMLSRDGTQKLYFVHRLVAMAFLPNPDNLPQVHHKDGNRENNRLSNLEWCTRDYNLSHTAHPSRPVYCIELDKTFKSSYAAAKFVNGNAGNLYAHLHGRQKTFSGYHWRYAD